MTDNIILRPYQKNDFDGILEVFNSFVSDSFSAYCDACFKVTEFRGRIEQLKIILVLTEKERIIGYGYLSNYKPYPNFSHTGILTYFILSEYTGKGFGTRLFNKLISIGKENGITNYLAHISSKNIQSLNFHKKQGFVEVGNFKEVGIKFNQKFDIVWMQKIFGDK
ncbi:GNAT family N-acetyltransferase [Bacteroidota bacterium]